MGSGRLPGKTRRGTHNPLPIPPTGGPKHAEDAAMHVSAGGGGP